MSPTTGVDRVDANDHPGPAARGGPTPDTPAVRGGPAHGSGAR